MRGDDAVDVAARFLQRLADVERLEQRELVLRASIACASLSREPAARGRRRSAPGALQRAVGGARRAVDVVGVAARDTPRIVLGGGIDGGEYLSADGRSATCRR